MASRNRRTRRQGAGGSRGARKAAGRGRRALGNGWRISLSSWAAVVIAGAVALPAIVGIGTFQVLWSTGSRSQFEVYQGQDVLGGSTVNFVDLLDDGRPVVLNFWGGDCPPCRAEMPAFQRVYYRHQDEITLVGLDAGVFTGLGTRRSALGLLEEPGITYPAGGLPSRIMLDDYSVPGLPLTIFFGADGEVFRRWEGGITEQSMEAIVSAMLPTS